MIQHILFKRYLPTIVSASRRRFTPQRTYTSEIEISDEISKAISSAKPIVALESTIISHGLPYPRNLEVAMRLEEVVRSEGAVPATIAIINGIPKVGLTQDDLKYLARPQSVDHTVMKASRRDLAFAKAGRLNAG